MGSLKLVQLLRVLGGADALRSLAMAHPLFAEIDGIDIDSA